LGFGFFGPWGNETNLPPSSHLGSVGRYMQSKPDRPRGMISESTACKRQRHQGTALTKVLSTFEYNAWDSWLPPYGKIGAALVAFTEYLIRQQGLGGGGDRQTFEAAEIQKKRP